MPFSLCKSMKCTFSFCNLFSYKALARRGIRCLFFEEKI